MKIERTQKEGCALIKIEGSVTIEDADALHKELLLGLTDSEGLIIDLSQLAGCDVSALQLFLSARFSTRQKGKKFKVVSPSSAAMAAVAGAGLYQEHFFKKA